jgi:FMN phosphatase YigB (HAD superfamily)
METKENIYLLIGMSFEKTQIKTGLFDADSVVIRKPDRYYYQIHAEEFGIPEERLLQFIQSSDYRSCLRGRVELTDLIRKYRDVWKWDKDPEILLNEHWFPAESKLDQDMLTQVLEPLAASGLPLFLATNNERARTKYIRDYVLPPGLFRGVFSSAELGSLKTDPEHFPSILASLSLSKFILSSRHPEQVGFVDDMLFNIDYARARGIRSQQYIAGSSSAGIEQVRDLFGIR